MDPNKEIMFNASVASSGNQTYSLKSTKKNLTLKNTKSCNFFKRKSAYKKKNDVEKRHKGSHNNHLLKKVISKSGPRSVPSTVVSHEKVSLMSKLISAGLAKNSSDIEKTAKVSLPSSEVNSLNSTVNKKEHKTKINQEEDDEDSEVEVIIPPKKVHTVVTLDSDGEEVTLSGIELSKNLENMANKTQLDSTIISSSRPTLCNSGLSKEQPSDDCENLGNLRSEVIPLDCCSSSENDSYSLSFTPSSPSSCNSIEMNLNQIATINVQLKEQIEIKTPYQALPDNNQVRSPHCLGTVSGLYEKNKAMVLSQSDITSSIKDSHLSLNSLSCEQGITKTSNAESFCSAPMSNVSTNRKAQSLAIESLNDRNHTSVNPKKVPLSSGEGTEDMHLVFGCTEIINRTLDCTVSNSVIHKDMGIINNTQKSNLVEHRQKHNDKQDLDCSNTSISNKNIEHCVSHLSASSIDTTSSFLCSSLEKPVNEDLNTGTNSFNSDNVGSSDERFIQLNDSSSDVKSGDDDISQLRLLALSSKGKSSPSLTHKDDDASTLENVSQSNTSADDEIYDNEEEAILLLRVAALKSAVIKKHEQRKKKGLLVRKKNSRGIESSSICDETLLLSKETSVDKNSVDNTSKPSQNVDLPPDSPVESLQGEEDMEISDSGETSDNQEKLVNNLAVSLETENLKNMSSPSYLPSFNNELGNMFQSIVHAPQPHPLGGTVSVEYSTGCVSDLFQNYSQPIPAVLPPPPLPPALIFNSLLSNPPPPPPPLPESEEKLKTLDQSTACGIESQKPTDLQKSRIIRLFDSDYSFNELEYFSSNAITENNVSSPFSTSKNESNIDGSIRTMEEIHEKVKTIEISSAFNENHQKKVRNVNKFKYAANHPLRRNLRKIPLAKNGQNKILKNKIHRLIRQNLKSTANCAEIGYEYNHSNSIIASGICTKNTIPLCITNTPIQPSTNWSSPKHNFPLCTTDSSIQERKTISTVDMNPTAMLCTESSSLMGNSTVATNKCADVCSKQNSYNPNNKSYELASEKDNTMQFKFQDEEMDLSNMIVLDEVGMSPEHKSSYDQFDYDSAKVPKEDDEDSLRVGALTLSKSKLGPSKSCSILSPQPNSKSDFGANFSVARRIPQSHKYDAVRDQASIGKREFKNFSITKKVNDCDSSIYKLTRVVTKEPCRTVVKGKESLKVVIPSETPPLLNSPQPFSVPVIERFVISVGKDSDSEEEGEWSRKVKVQETPFTSSPENFSKDHDLERSVDLLLSSTRKRIENASFPAKTKPIPSRINIKKSITPVSKRNLIDDSSDTPLVSKTFFIFYLCT